MSKKMHFPKRSGVEFAETLKQRVDAYFQEKNMGKQGNLWLYTKGSLALIATIVCYILLVFGGFNVWWCLVLSFLLSQSMIVLAFNTMHDGGHNSFSKNKTVNKVASWSMELLGSSSMLWRQKHNVLHHTYTNIDGKDDDLDIGGLLRLSPHQQHHWWHRYQAFYAPVLYSLLSLYLVFWSDFKRMICNRIGDMPLQKRTSKDISFFVGGKLLYFTYALLIPALMHGFTMTVAFFILVHLFFGFSLSVVFQLAHTVEGTEFPEADEHGTLPFNVSEHQLRTTSDFAQNSWFATFYCGGLNFQVEHHLFHTVSHVHYPALSKIVRQTCEEYNVPYHCQPSVFSALKSHFSFLHRVGQSS